MAEERVALLGNDLKSLISTFEIESFNLSPSETSSTESNSEGQLSDVERQLITVKKEVNIVFVGKSGAGKSVLQNSILGIEAELKLSSTHITENHTTHKEEKHGVTISITDTIGLQGKKAECRKILKGISKVQGNVDLLVYCIPVSLIVANFSDPKSGTGSHSPKPHPHSIGRPHTQTTPIFDLASCYFPG